MTQLRIPESSFEAVQNLIRIGERDFELFLDALSKAEPSLDQDKFWRHVADHVESIDKGVIRSLLREVFEMDDARSQTGQEIPEFADSIAQAALGVKSKEFSINAGDEKILKDRLMRIFEGRKGLEITSKAMGILLDQSHVFYSAAILTDIRPVFNKKGDSVDAAVIVHNLRIHYGQDSEHKDFFVALDTSDIQSLRKALDRADLKAKCLQGLVKKAGVSYLDSEEE